jgi:hypothetical protein
MLVHPDSIQSCPSSRLVLRAVLAVLVDCGYEGLTLDEIRYRAGAVAHVVDASVDLEELVVVAIKQVHLFHPPKPSGPLRSDLLMLLRPWLGGPHRHARAVAAVLSAAQWSPRLQEAVIEALDRPLMQALGAILTRAAAAGEPIPSHRRQTPNWILRSLAVDQLRAPPPRSPVDLEQLIDLLLAVG